MSDEETPRPGCLGPIAWISLALLVTLAGGAWLGLSIADSETAGVQASQIVISPISALWAAALVAGILWIAKVRSGAARFGAPVGCGCFTLIGVAGLVFTFFAVIFPSL